VGIYSSGIAPVSGGMCQKCVDIGAENLWVIYTWIAFNIGADPKPPNDPTASYPETFAGNLISFHEGAYIKWGRILELYKENKQEIRSFINEGNAISE